jgi:hypothetical protein
MQSGSLVRQVAHEGEVRGRGASPLLHELVHRVAEELDHWSTWDCPGCLQSWPRRGGYPSARGAESGAADAHTPQHLASPLKGQRQWQGYVGGGMAPPQRDAQTSWHPSAALLDPSAPAHAVLCRRLLPNHDVVALEDARPCQAVIVDTEREVRGSSRVLAGEDGNASADTPNDRHGKDRFAYRLEHRMV